MREREKEEGKGKNEERKEEGKEGERSKEGKNEGGRIKKNEVQERGGNG